ncbi:hypothetical protein SAMN05216262_10791 [Colwellia chukchiensis]|uniref:Uncharacterized protein n=1 Tax=Colwellia chukchiensis TaxID=641665 RepID=A0A1H7ND63_9GAMM|nr:hypothetical protein [Colwellia chukchiensis]SEL20878.1 hypothetical protein SAMN05216262_10791 [Colwellia chukchiensis]
MLKSPLLVLAILITPACVVLPEVKENQHYQCGLSSDKKTLKVVNLMAGDTSFYQWHDELLSLITLPSTAVISSTYVAVNNIYHLGEKVIKCGS